MCFPSHLEQTSYHIGDSESLIVAKYLRRVTKIRIKIIPILFSMIITFGPYYAGRAPVISIKRARIQNILIILRMLIKFRAFPILHPESSERPPSSAFAGASYYRGIPGVFGIVYLPTRKYTTITRFGKTKEYIAISPDHHTIYFERYIEAFSFLRRFIRR